MTKIWVLTELSANEIERVSFELLGEARRLARRLDAKVEALALGDKIESVTETLAHYGAETVYLIQDPRLRHYNPDLYIASIAQLCKQHEPVLVLFPATSTGSDVAVRLATSFGWPLVPRCVNFRVRKGEIEMIRTFAQGKIQGVLTSAQPGPRLATVAPDVIGVDKPDPAQRARAIPSPTLVPDRVEVNVTDFIPGDPHTLDLSEAEIVVSVGRGLESQENMHLIEDLAEVLGASVGCSRPVIDLGWLPHSAQVGQTGATVNPRLYLACGISGATQHTIGMKDADTILAINTDPGAPIFRIADLGLVADIKQIVPMLIEHCRSESRET